MSQWPCVCQSVYVCVSLRSRSSIDMAWQIVLAYFRLSYTVLQKNSDASKNNSELGLESWGSIYKISYDLSYDYRKFIV